jgi:hypothetical protein
MIRMDELRDLTPSISTKHTADSILCFLKGGWRHCDGLPGQGIWCSQDNIFKKYTRNVKLSGGRPLPVEAREYCWSWPGPSCLQRSSAKIKKLRAKKSSSEYNRNTGRQTNRFVEAGALLREIQAY